MLWRSTARALPRQQTALHETWNKRTRKNCAPSIAAYSFHGLSNVLQCSQNLLPLRPTTAWKTRLCAPSNSGGTLRRAKAVPLFLRKCVCLCLCVCNISLDVKLATQVAQVRLWLQCQRKWPDFTMILKGEAPLTYMQFFHPFILRLSWHRAKPSTPTPFCRSSFNLFHGRLLQSGFGRYGPFFYRVAMYGYSSWVLGATSMIYIGSGVMFGFI